MGVKLLVAVLAVLAVFFVYEYVQYALRRWPGLKRISEHDVPPLPMEMRSSNNVRLLILEIVPGPPVSMTRDEIQERLETRLHIRVPRQRLYAELNEMVRNDRTLTVHRSRNGTQNYRRMRRRYQKLFSTPR